MKREPNALDRWRALPQRQRRAALDALDAKANELGALAATLGHYAAIAAASPTALPLIATQAREKSDEAMERKRGVMAAASLLRAAGFLSLKQRRRKS